MLIVVICLSSFKKKKLSKFTSIKISIITITKGVFLSLPIFFFLLLLSGNFLTRSTIYVKEFFLFALCNLVEFMKADLKILWSY